MSKVNSDFEMAIDANKSETQIPQIIWLYYLSTNSDQWSHFELSNESKTRNPTKIIWDLQAINIDKPTRKSRK